MRTLVAVTVRTATVVAAGLLTMLLVDRLTGPTVGADIGSGLLAFTVGAALVTVWAFRDGLRAPALARPLVHWLLTAILVALAMGTPAEAAAPNSRAEAIAKGFAADAALPDKVRVALDSGRLGEAILRAMDYLDRGARGNPVDLSGALAALRLVGLEDMTRRAALQLMLLDRGR